MMPAGPQRLGGQRITALTPAQAAAAAALRRMADSAWCGVCQSEAVGGRRPTGTGDASAARAAPLHSLTYTNAATTAAAPAGFVSLGTRLCQSSTAKAAPGAPAGTSTAADMHVGEPRDAGCAPSVKKVVQTPTSTRCSKRARLGRALEEAPQAIDLTHSDSDSDCVPANPAATAHPAGASRQSAATRTCEQYDWACTVCTLSNRSGMHVCDACGAANLTPQRLPPFR